jgi:hypothetical protein
VEFARRISGGNLRLASSRFFEKKRRKKLLLIEGGWVAPRNPPMAFSQIANPNGSGLTALRRSCQKDQGPSWVA